MLRKGSFQVVVGGQAGDEAKGAEVHRLATGMFREDLVVRYGGGNNAGHTVGVIDDQGKEVGLALHLLPTAVAIQNGPRIGIGGGTVVNPIALCQEIADAKRFGFEVDGRLTIDARCAVVMPWHPIEDMAREAVLRRTGDQIGTTGSGMGPVHVDIVAREGLRYYDFDSPERFVKLFTSIFARKQQQLDHLGLTDDEWQEISAKLRKKNKVNDLFLQNGQMNHQAMLDHTMVAMENLKRFVGDVAQLVLECLYRGHNVIAEGSQGYVIDSLLGTGRYSTPGRTIAGAAASGIGVGPTLIDRVRGVFKAVPSKVGDGPFPTQLTDPLLIAEAQGDGTKIDDERGASTGRPRNIGVFDAVVARSAINANGANLVSLTKFDKVRGPALTRIAVAYTINGQRYTEVPVNPDKLSDPSLEVEYLDLEPWTEDVSGFTNYYSLPEAARKFVETLEEILNLGRYGERVKIDRITTGPMPENVILR